MGDKMKIEYKEMTERDEFLENMQNRNFTLKFENMEIQIEESNGFVDVVLRNTKIEDEESRKDGIVITSTDQVFFMGSKREQQKCNQFVQRAIDGVIAGEDFGSISGANEIDWSNLE